MSLWKTLFVPLGLFKILDTFMVENNVSGQNTLVFVLIMVIRCLVGMECCRRVFEAELQIHRGPSSLFTEKHCRQSNSALHLNLFLKCVVNTVHFYKNLTSESTVIQNKLCEEMGAE